MRAHGHSVSNYPSVFTDAPAWEYNNNYSSEPAHECFVGVIAPNSHHIWVNIGWCTISITFQYTLL
jgi:hypothetical protein